LAIYWQGERLVVDRVLDVWRAPDGKYYRISAQGEQIFELHYSELTDAWSIVQS
jgi:hypothetical protein